MSRSLILGGARSGKSVFAEKLASTNSQVTYIATAQAGDVEMQKRIQHHRARRPGHWTIIEEPVELAAVIDQYSGTDNCILVDCLTLWVSNLLLLEQQQQQQAMTALVDVISESRNNIILVSNEVGMGIVPVGELSRLFCDQAGRLHQQLAQVCDQVVLMVAGLPMFIKGSEV